VSSRNHQLSALYDEGALWIYLAMNLPAFWITTAVDPDCWRLVRLISIAMLIQKLTFRLLGKDLYRVWVAPQCFSCLRQPSALPAPPEGRVHHMHHSPPAAPSRPQPPPSARLQPPPNPQRPAPCRPPLLGAQLPAAPGHRVPADVHRRCHARPAELLQLRRQAIQGPEAVRDPMPQSSGISMRL
jgi:hypothetical protein